MAKDMRITSWFVVAMVISSCMGASLTGLPVGNPSEPLLLSADEGWSLRFGYCNDVVGSTAVRANQWSQQARWMTNSAQCTLNLYGRCDLFATIGMLSFKTRPDILASALPENQNANACLNIQSFPSPAYGVGGRITLLSIQQFALGAEGQWLHSNPKPFFSTIQNRSKHIEEQSASFNQQQLGLAASYTFPWKMFVVPYAGLRWLKTTLNFDRLSAPKTVGGSLKNLEQADPWTGVAGLSLIGQQRWGVSLEGNVWNQPSMSFTAQFRY